LTKPPARPPADKHRRWSNRVTRESDALELEEGVFTKNSPRAIALSLKRSAETSTRLKGSAFQSAMSMLNFYVNRARPQPARGAPGGAGKRQARASQGL